MSRESHDPRRLPTLPPGTRVRLFWREGGEKKAVSGALVGVRDGRVRVAPDGDGEVVIAVADVTCMYLPRSDRGDRPGARPGRLDRLRAVWARLAGR